MSRHKCFRWTKHCSVATKFNISFRVGAYNRLKGTYKLKGFYKYKGQIYYLDGSLKGPYFSYNIITKRKRIGSGRLIFNRGYNAFSGGWKDIYGHNGTWVGGNYKRPGSSNNKSRGKKNPTSIYGI